MICPRAIKGSENIRGISSAGRAPALQAGGRRFDPVILHQINCRQDKKNKTTRKRRKRENNQHQSGFARGFFVVDRYYSINRLFFNNS
jgi:hypothetical protein